MQQLKVKYGIACKVLKSMYVMSNNFIQLRSKFHFCASKFDHNCAQSLISGNFGAKLVGYLVPVIWNSLIGL